MSETKDPSRYFRRMIREWAQRQKSRVRKLVGHLRSPLVALLLLGLALYLPAPASWGWGQRAPLLLATAWVIRRFLQYDSDYFFGLWFVGILKLRNSLFMTSTTVLRLMEPRPLDALSATIDLTRIEASIVRIAIGNHSPWPVQHLSVLSTSLADLLAPQCLEAVRAGRLDRQAVEARFPDLQRRWLWPFRSVTWTVAVEPQELPHSFQAQLDVLLCISRFASGDRRSVRNTYLIPIRVLKR